MASVAEPVLALDGLAGYCVVSESMVPDIFLCEEESVAVRVPVDMVGVCWHGHHLPWSFMMHGVLSFLVWLWWWLEILVWWCFPG